MPDLTDQRLTQMIEYADRSRNWDVTSQIIGDHLKSVITELRSERAKNSQVKTSR